MNTIGYLLGALLIAGSLNGSAQNGTPDQNPNHERAAQRYVEQANDLTTTQSTTIQDTYKAYDWREAKAEAKQERIDRRYELRKLKYQSRYYNRGYYNPYRRNYGYYNNPHWYNNGYYNNGFYNGGYYNGGYFGNNCGTLLNGAALGLGIYNLFN
ncbi:hypothetical protein [Crocinitomix algicola]|uniref:hypothetical protein n=1 Tax=Crocinitomix algicola TaxID=1740263 RepID=UPI001112ECE3|nr:hypothetical protein [Crocinitomix algicola]